MELEKVTEVLKENEKKKFWGKIEIEFRGGNPTLVTKTQSILYDKSAYQPQNAESKKAAGEIT